VSGVTLEGVGKRYRKYEDSAVLISRGRARIRRTRRSEIWAVRGIDLEVEPRECLGVIGRNGGGKTTMLQLLAGVSAPTEGKVTVRGRVAPLMAVGVGFHPELTGRENVYINGTILGMERSDIDAAFADIVAFSDIGDFIDTPVKFYSSGMMVRLGMSVAVRSTPDILLVDEVLAVGDVAFQARCFERMQEIREGGATVIVVSHNLDAIRILCDRTMLLTSGSSAYLGDTTEAISRYHQLLDEEREPEHEGDDGRVDSPTTAGAHVASVELSDTSGQRVSSFSAGDELVAAVSVAGCPPLGDVPPLEITVSTGGGLLIYREELGVDHRADTMGHAAVDLRVPALLPTGSYKLVVGVAGAPGAAASRASRPLSFYVAGRPGMRGHADLRAAFSRTPDEVARP
jgi:ABC-type polysaccharide/polyol phosphate transport system ATPase subunit